jgi:hypothetical protein
LTVFGECVSVSRNDSTDESGSRSIAVDDILDDERLAPLRSFSWGTGIVTGALSFLVGYVLVAMLFFVGPASITASSLTVRLQRIGVIFYNAHFVDRIVAAPKGTLVPGVEPRLNLLLVVSDSVIPIVVYFAIPVAVLLAVSVAFSKFVLSGTELADAALTGLSMALGYLAVALLLTFLVTRPIGGGGAAFVPDRIQTVALCFAYPFVLGTLGALGGLLLGRE